MQVYNDEIYHTGKLGMKWGKRSTRGTTPRMLTAKRQLTADKKTLDQMNNGNHHVSVGLTKNRQEAYDKRDKAILEKRIVKNNNKIAKKEERQALRKELKQMQKDTIIHPVHSAVEQFKLLKNKPLKALNLDMESAKQINEAVKKKVDADKVNRQKHINNGYKIVKNLFN